MIEKRLGDIHACIIIPTYNNEKTLLRVIEGVLEYAHPQEVIVVNDGSTDTTSHLLLPYENRISILSYPKNKGKGYALRKGFKKAIELGFENTITIDSDGQHFPDDIPVFIDAALEHKGALLMGSRNMSQEGVPGKSSFGNKFSNFWYKLETGIDLPDTQTGFRLYPLAPLQKIKLYTTKFETEIEVIVKLAWKGVEVLPVDIKVLYDPDERVSHFRPFKDFTRISILNTYLVILTALWYLPKRIILASKKKEFWVKLKKDIIQPRDSIAVKAASVGFGFFMGIVPIWGFQLLIGIPLAIAFKLNKVLFVAAANISIPPMIPFILLGSYAFGGLFYDTGVELPPLSEFTLDTIYLSFTQYAIGAVLLALAMGVIGFIFTFFALKWGGYKPVVED